MDRQSLTTTRDEDPLAQADTLKVLSCPICRAVYIPSSRQQEVVRGPEALLESAFLGVCHFCFRCQRPSCPQCWNPIHHVCASCSEEARLPFRSPVPSLEGLIFSSQVFTQNSQEALLSFTCLRNGNFYLPASLPRAESLENNQASSLSAYPITSGDLPAIQANSGTPASTSSYPEWLQEVMHPRQSEQNSRPLAPTSRQWENNSASRPMLAQPSGANQPVNGQWGNNVAAWSAQGGPMAVSPHTSRPDWPPVAPAVPPMPSLPLLAVANPAEKSQVRDDVEDDEDISLFERIENVLIIVISALLLAIMLIIVLAISSPAMNTFFFHLLHIDIRTEILYLLQLR